MKCSFCGKEIIKGRGKIFVKKDGTIYNFCSNKCEKNLIKLGRSQHSVKWTREYHKIKEQQKRSETREERKEKEKGEKK